MGVMERHEWIRLIDTKSNLSQTQRQEMKDTVIRFDQLLEHTLNNMELYILRANQGSITTEMTDD